MVFIPGVPGFPPGASWRAVPKSPRREPGDSGWRGFPVAMREGAEQPRRMRPNGMVGRDGVHSRCPRVSTRGFLARGPKKPPAEAGGLRVARLPGCHARRRGTAAAHAAKRHGGAGWCSFPVSPGFHPGLLGARSQKAPGGSRGTPGGEASRLPCEKARNRRGACGQTAWGKGWPSCPESPGFHPGLLGVPPQETDGGVLAKPA